METTKEQVNDWLDETHRDREWLADQCGVKLSAVGNWLNRKGDSVPIPARHQITIRRLMDEDAAANSAKPPHNLVLEFADPDYAAIERSAVAQRKTIREWAKDTLLEAAEMDVAAVAAAASDQFPGVNKMIPATRKVAPENVLAFPEIPLYHAAAGSPIAADVDTYIPTKEYGPGRIACRLHGDSMAPRFQDGSTVILRSKANLKRPVLKRGEIYLFDIGGERTLKTYASRPATKAEIKSGISYVSAKDGTPKVSVLRSINPAFTEIVLTPEDDPEWLAWLDPKDPQP